MIRRDLLTSLRLPCGDKYRLVIRQGDIDALYVFIAQIEAINILMQRQLDIRRELGIQSPSLIFRWRQGKIAINSF